MIKWNVKENCSGCSSCASICPKQCIRMTQDDEGFFYPQVDAQNCIQCGLCLKACPMDPSRPDTAHSPTAYAMINPDNRIRACSTSGGIFTLIAQYVLSQDGVVFGAAVTEDAEIRHIAVDSPSELYRLRGSKYVQSQLGDSFANAKQQLCTGRLVFFTGTPCQIAGFKAYLGKDYKNLICQDVICHGVPSPAVWKRYVAYREALAGAKTKTVSFRHKAPSWTNYRLRFDFENGTYYEQPKNKDPYLQAFLSNLCLRPSCHACHFKGLQRQADITLADYWGIWDVHPQMHDDKGTSLVFIHSAKGASVLEAIQDRVVLCPTEIGSSLQQNNSMLTSAPKPSHRERFFTDIQTMAFDQAVRKNRSRIPLGRRCRQKITRFLRKILHKV